LNFLWLFSRVTLVISGLASLAGMIQIVLIFSLIGEKQVRIPQGTAGIPLFILSHFRFFVLLTLVMDLAGLIASVALIKGKRWGQLNARDGRVGAIRDWATLRRHEMWAYRRYRHDDVDKMAAGTDEVTPDAEALAFMVDLEKRVGVLRLHSSTQKTAEKWGRRILPAFKLVSRGTWETTVPLADAQAGERMFVIMALFGFGVYL